MEAEKTGKSQLEHGKYRKSSKKKKNGVTTCEKGVKKKNI
jgi:hypothetical protein